MNRPSASRVAALYLRASEDDDLQARISEMDDALRLARSLVDDLPSDAGSDVVKGAEAVLAALDTAETVEVLADFEANVADAKSRADALTPILKKARAAAKTDGDDALVEALGEAAATLKDLLRELRDL